MSVPSGRFSFALAVSETMPAKVRRAVAISISRALDCEWSDWADWAADWDDWAKTSATWSRPIQAPEASAARTVRVATARTDFERAW